MPSAWPSGDSKPFAQIALSVEAVESRAGRRFQRDRDDLDWYQGLYLVDVDVGPLALMKYDNAPVDGIVAYMDSLARVESALGCLVRRLNLEQEDFLWRVTDDLS